MENNETLNSPDLRKSNVAACYAKAPEWWNIRWTMLNGGDEIMRGDWVCKEYPYGPWLMVANSDIGNPAPNTTFKNAPIYRRCITCG